MDDTAVKPEDVQESLEEATTLDVSPKKELAKLSDTYFKQNLKVGLEELTPDDLPTPTITIVTPSSKARDKDGRPYIPGQFYFSGLKKAYSTIDITMLCYTKQELPSYEDKTILEKNYVFLGVIEEDGEMLPFKWYLKKTGIGAAKRLLGDVTAARMPMFALKLNATTQLKNGEKFDYHVVEFKITGVHQDPEKIIILENLAKNYAPNMAEEALKTETEEKPGYVSTDMPF